MPQNTTGKSFDYRTKVLILSTLLGVLSLTAVLGVVFSQQSTAQRQAQLPLLAGFQPGAVVGLQVGPDIALTKATTWTLTYQGKPYAASADRAETYLKTLFALQRERLVTQDGDPKAFGLDKDFRTLKLLGGDGKVLYELQVGGTNDLGDKVYVRFAGQKEIWQTDRGFARTLDLDFNTWADLALFPGRKEADLTRITFDSRIETAEKTVYAPFDLVRTTKAGKNSWEDRVSKASTDIMNSWASLVVSFRFGAYAGPNEAASVGASLGTLTLSWSDGTSTQIKIGPADAQGRYRSTDGTRDFWINDWSLGQLLYK